MKNHTLRMSASPFAPPTEPPTLGEHTEFVLTEELGLTLGQIGQLETAGVIQRGQVVKS